MYGGVCQSNACYRLLRLNSSPTYKILCYLTKTVTVNYANDNANDNEDALLDEFKLAIALLTLHSNIDSIGVRLPAVYQEPYLTCC
ncbi:hypothetical protein M0804_011578 [Polistes exclamans]|nr:hypothetical protein M0804_011578 [Polistes exclamans]